MGIRTPADLRDRSRTVTQDAAQSTRLTPLGASPERGTRQRGINYLIRDVGVPGFSIDRPVSVPRLVHFSPPTNTRALRLLGCGAGNRLLRVLLICACRVNFWSLRSAVLKVVRTGLAGAGYRSDLTIACRRICALTMRPTTRKEVRTLVAKAKKRAKPKKPIKAKKPVRPAPKPQPPPPVPPEGLRRPDAREYTPPSARCLLNAASPPTGTQTSLFLVVESCYKPSAVL